MGVGAGFHLGGLRTTSKRVAAVEPLLSDFREERFMYDERRGSHWVKSGVVALRPAVLDDSVVVAA